MSLSNKKQGIHLYINIRNFNDIVLEEEKEIGRVNHSIHALDTYFSSIERFCNNHYREVLSIEKITGARLHIYIEGEISTAFDYLEHIVSYAFNLSKLVNKDIPKYKTLKDFQIQVGADYGDFYEFLFCYQGESNEVYEELTTIGFAANYAAKLQGLAGISQIAISETLYTECITDEDYYTRLENNSIKRYGEKCYYVAGLQSISKTIEISNEELDWVKNYAQEVNLTDMDFPMVKQSFSFRDLSKINGKKIKGIPLFADVRGFTNKFKKDDVNLDEMAKETKRILTSMYNVSTKQGGVHVQFQGDREEVLFYDVGENVCFEKAVFAGMRMIDAISDVDVHIGVGADYGTLFAARIGKRGEKDNILIGSTVIEADKLEDEKAKENQIAISKDIYEGLVSSNSSLIQFFSKNSSGIYIATIGYREYLATMESIQHKKGTQKGGYHGAWRDE